MKCPLDAQHEFEMHVQHKFEIIGGHSDYLQNTELVLRLGLELGSQRQTAANPNPPIQPDLIPSAPVPRCFSWHLDTKMYQPPISENDGMYVGSFTHGPISFRFNGCPFYLI